MSLSLYEISRDYQGLFSHLTTLDELSPEHLEEINKIEGTLENKAIAIASMIKNLDAEGKAIEEAIKSMKERQARLITKMESMEDYLKTTLEQCGIKEIKSSPYFKIAIRSCPERVIVDREDIPEDYLRVKVIKEPDKKKIKDLIKSGAECDFAHLEMDTRLEIK